MADEPTLGEIVRRLEAVHADLKEDVRELGSRLDSKVSMERYTIEQAARDEGHKRLAERVSGLEEAREQERRDRDRERQEENNRRRTDRRLVFTALIAPIVVVLVQTWLATKGAGG